MKFVISVKKITVTDNLREYAENKISKLDKYFRDEQSVDMMNLIYDGILYDFGYVFDNWLGTTCVLPKITQSKNTNLASYWAQIEKKVAKHYQKLYDAVLEDE